MTTISGPSYNAFTTIFTFNSAPITTISADITFNELAAAVNGTSSYFNMINAHFSDGTAAYIGIHEPGSTFPGTTFSQGSVDLALFGASASSTITNSATTMNGSNTYSFVDGGLPSFRLYNGTMPIVAGDTYTVTMTLANNNLYGYITDKTTGQTIELGSINNIGETSFANYVNPGHEFTNSDLNSSLEPSDDVTISNILFNGAAGQTSNNNGVYISNLDQSAVGNPIGTQATREVFNDGMETVSGAGTNTVQLMAYKTTIVGGNANSEIQLTATYHDLTGSSITNVPILDLNGQNGAMSLSQYEGFTTFENGQNGIMLSTVGTVDVKAGLGSIALGYGANVVNMHDSTVSSANIISAIGQATTAVFDGKASQYTITGDGDGLGVTVTGRVGSVTSVDHFNTVSELQFSDATEFVASTTPPTGAQVSSAQIVELYSAVLAREPDVGGLPYYEGVAVTQPQTTFLTYAEYFLGSPEYKNNTAHSYAQSEAGDAQFITDSYNNLLHRAPEAGAVDFYYNNVIAPAVKGLTPGTTAYAQAELQAHAQVLVYFSQSPEFLGDVSITATNPASATHWLQLV